MRKNSRVKRWLALILCMTLVLSTNTVSMAAEENGTEVQAVTEAPAEGETEAADAAEVSTGENTEASISSPESVETTGEAETQTEASAPEETEAPADTEAGTESESVEQPGEPAAEPSTDNTASSETEVKADEGATGTEDFAEDGIMTLDITYPEYINNQQTGEEHGHPHLAVIGTDFRWNEKNQSYDCIWTTDYNPPQYGKRDKHYVKLVDTNDIDVITAIRCDLYGGQKPNKEYYPVYYINGETKKSFLHNPLFESVEKNEENPNTPQNVPEAGQSGKWTLGTYDGPTIEVEDELVKVVDTNQEVVPGETLIKGRTFFIWHDNEEVTSDFTFLKADDITQEPLSNATFELYQADENGQVQGDVLQTVVSGENTEQGLVVFSNLNPGTYVIKEVSVPSGYVSSDKFQWKLVMDEEGTGHLYNMSGTEILAEGNNQYPTVYNYQVKEHIKYNKTATLQNWEDRTYKIDLYASHDIVADIPANIVFTVDISGSMPWILEKPTGGTTTIKEISSDDKKKYTIETGGITGIEAWTGYKYYVYRDEEYKPIGYEGNRYRGNWHIVKSKSDGTKVYDSETISERETIYIKGNTDIIKLEALLSSMESFVNKLKEVSPNTKVAIVPFAGDVKGGDNSLTSVSNYNFNSFKNDVQLYGGTNQASGISKATNILVSETTTNPNYILLFTDGRSDNENDASVAANEAKKQGITIFAAGLYNEGLAGSQKENLDEWASEDKNNNPYSYLATTPEGLNSAFNEIFASMNLMIQGVSVKDYVDTSRFDIVDAQGNVVTSGAYGSNGWIGQDSNGTYVIWNNVKLGYASDPKDGWHQSIYVKAKDTYMGGNNIKTNLSGSGVDVEGVHLEFPKPDVDVLVRFQVEDAERRIFLGESLEQVFDTKVKSILTTPKYENTELTDLRDVTKNVTYYTDEDLNQLVQAEGCQPGSEEALKAQNPDKDMNYYAKVSMIPSASSNTPSNPGNCLENINQSDGIGTYAIAKFTVRVESGSVTVTKKLSKTDFELTGKKQLNFEFVLQDGTQEVKKIATITAESKQDGNYYTANAEFKNLPKGRYKLVETPVDEFTVESMTLKGASNNPCDIENDEIFLIGQGDDEERFQRKNGVAEVVNILTRVNGSIEITKEIEGEHHNSYEGDPIFTFKIEQLTDSNAVKRTEYKTVRFYPGEDNQKLVAKLEGLERGKYRITELSAQKYDMTKIKVQEGTNCKCDVFSEEKAVTVYIGTPDTKMKNALGDTAKILFNNKKIGGNTNTDTDVIVNKFTYDEKTGEYTVTQELQEKDQTGAWEGGKNNK